MHINKWLGVQCIAPADVAVCRGLGVLLHATVVFQLYYLGSTFVVQAQGRGGALVLLPAAIIADGLGSFGRTNLEHLYFSWYCSVLNIGRFVS